MTDPATESAPPATPQPAPDRAAAKRPPRPNKARARAPAAPAYPMLERLFQLYPKLFGARFLPLKLGVFHDLMERHAEEFKKEELKVALGVHARSTRYLESVAAGEARHDLDGTPVEPVAPEHVHHAIMEVFRRRQARSREDLRPWLRERLLHAIEQSGLARDEYLARVQVKDEAAMAALDEAFAQRAAVAARREALQRAFHASGKSIEAFAEMYGMDLAIVRDSLGHAATGTPGATLV